MNFITILRNILLAGCLINCAEDGKVPQSVVDAFQSRYPSADVLSWELESNDVWEADFLVDEIEYSASFRKDGRWLGTEYEIQTNEIPKNVIESVDKKYNEFQIEEVELMETTNGKYYIFEIEVRAKEFEITVDMQGKIKENELFEDQD